MHAGGTQAGGSTTHADGLSEETFSITLPDGCTQGDRLAVALPDGRAVEIIVPQGAASGGQVGIRVPSHTQQERAMPAPAGPTHAPPAGPAQHTLPGAARRTNFTAHAGDIEVSVHNMRGGSRIDVCTEYLARRMQHTHMHGMIETNHDTTTNVIIKHKTERTGQYRWFGNPITQGNGRTGKGTALMVARSILAPPADRAERPGDNESIYKDGKGKAQAVHLYIRGRPTVVIIMHLPHTDADRTKFLDKQAEAISGAIQQKMSKDAYTEWPAIVRMADNNMVRDPRMDCVPSEGDSAARAHEAMARFTRAVSPKGLRDVYRITDPDGRATTYTRVAKDGNGTKCRYDTIDVSADIANGTSCVARTRHQSPDEVMVFYMKGAQRCAKRSDHSLVTTTIRYTNTPRPPREYAIPQDILETGEADDDVNAALRVARNMPTQDDIDGYTEAWQSRINAVFKGIEKRRRQAEYAAIAAARKRVDAAEREVLATDKTKHPTQHKNRSQKLSRLRANLARLYERRQRTVAAKRGTLAAATADEERLMTAAKSTSHAPILAVNDPETPGGVLKTQSEIHTVIDGYWRTYLNRQHTPNAAKRQEVLAGMAKTKRLPAGAASVSSR